MKKQREIFMLIGVLALATSASGREPEVNSELRNTAKKIALKTKVNSSCKFGTEFVSTAFFNALIHIPSPEKILVKEAGFLSITCVDFDKANIEEMPNEIVIDTNLDTSNALNSLTEKISEQLEANNSILKK